MIRLFPVPFRLIKDDIQFKKWQWIKVRIAKASNDHRPESHTIYVDTINCEGEPLSTAKGWFARRTHLDRIPIFDDFNELDAARETMGLTLGLVRPSKIVGLDLTAVANPDWTVDEMPKRVQHQQQAGLFDDADTKSLAVLKKLPADFHYRYVCETNGQQREYRHKIVDWEAGALYWNCKRSYPVRRGSDRSRRSLRISQKRDSRFAN